MKAPSASETRDLAIAAAVVAVGYALYSWLVPGEEDPGSGEAGEVDDAEADPRPATFTEAEALGLAGGLKVALFGGPWEDEDSAVDILLRPLVTDDVRLLVNAFGNYGTLFTPTYNLGGAVRAYLSADDIAVINDRYLVRDIQYRF